MAKRVLTLKGNKLHWGRAHLYLSQNKSWCVYYGRQEDSRDSCSDSKIYLYFHFGEMIKVNKQISFVQIAIARRKPPIIFSKLFGLIYDFEATFLLRLQYLLANQLMTTKEQEYIEYHQQFDKLVYLKGKEIPLAPTPMKGVLRKILERRGDEVARRATSVVSYAPDSSFSAHVHSFGQEFYVLEGTFSDHTGDFSAGWYVRNPVKSSHAPFSKEGTKIFVKLGQFPIDESQPLRLNTNVLDFCEVAQGVKQLVLYESPYEQVLLYKLEKGAVLADQEKPDISEIFVVSGTVQICEIILDQQSWIRIPKGTKYHISAVEESKIYIKIGKGIVRNKDWSELTF